jgi:DNA-binding CsgD family transcriptional regulator
VAVSEMREFRSDSALSQLLRQLEQASSTSHLQTAFEKAIEPMGYRYFAYHMIQCEILFESPDRQMHGVTNYPTKWVNHYASNDYVNYDPVVGHVLESRVPFIWSSAILPDRIPPQQKRLLDEARDFGIRDGVTIPLISRRGERASVSLIRDDRLRIPEAVLSSYGELHVMCEFFHSHALPIVSEAYLNGLSNRRRSLLTPREMQSLFWVARGKSAWEIAKILEISSKSVEFYLDTAKKKLNAVNRTQAAVRAAKLGLLDIEPSLAGFAPSSQPKSAERESSQRLVLT